jgi:hypothetical protein
MAEMDFPLSPAIGQSYINDIGVLYQWTGYGWVVGYVDNLTQDISLINGLLSQVRTLLQDTDDSSGGYRYSDDSLVTNLNQGLLEMYRIRPDIFLDQQFVVPQYTVGQVGDVLPIEPQFIPALVYYIVGLAQMRDDEPTQDARASSFLGKFTSMLIAVA